MYQLILIRFGELSLKKKNKFTFINYLVQNILYQCKLNKNDLIVHIDRIFIPYSNENMNNLKYVFGISSFSPVLIVESNIEKIKEEINAKVISKKDFTNNLITFKINTRRKDKTIKYNSCEINNLLGEFVLTKTKWKVNLETPLININLEIHKDKTYLFFDKIEGLGGLPVGSSGKSVHLLSGGIDSPVAAFLMMKRGIKLTFLSFISPPSTDEKTINKIKEIVSVLSLYQGKTNLYFYNYTKIMNYIGLTSNQDYKIILMRRSFYRIATNFANKQKIFVLSNGDNLGQVASQTLESLNVVSQSTNLLILRPLLTYDKQETISLSAKLNLYPISIRKCNETCELFAPKTPTTKPNIEKVISLENELNLLSKLEEEEFNNVILKEKFN